MDAVWLSWGLPTCCASRGNSVTGVRRRFCSCWSDPDTQRGIPRTLSVRRAGVSVVGLLSRPLPPARENRAANYLALQCSLGILSLPQLVLGWHGPLLLLLPATAYVSMLGFASCDLLGPVLTRLRYGAGASAWVAGAYNDTTVVTVTRVSKSASTPNGQYSGSDSAANGLRRTSQAALQLSSATAITMRCCMQPSKR